MPFRSAKFTRSRDGCARRPLRETRDIVARTHAHFIPTRPRRGVSAATLHRRRTRARSFDVAAIAEARSYRARARSRARARTRRIWNPCLGESKVRPIYESDKRSLDWTGIVSSRFSSLHVILRNAVAASSCEASLMKRNGPNRPSRYSFERIRLRIYSRVLLTIFLSDYVISEIGIDAFSRRCL